MKAALITGQDRLELLDFEQPRPSPTGVVVDITYCGICGTDVASYPDRAPPQSGGLRPRVGRHDQRHGLHRA